MISNYLIGIAIGCAVMIAGYWLFPPQREKDQRKKLKAVTNENLQLKRKNHELQTNLKREINDNRERITAIEHRQDQADQWFGSVIRHSRQQFDKDAIEAFLKEQGLEEGE